MSAKPVRTDLQIVKVKVLSPVLAPFPSEPFLKLIVSRYLVNKYTPLFKDKEKAERVLGSIDRAFIRMVNPVTGEVQPAIRGSQIYGAIKEAIGMSGRPLKYPTIYGVFFDEADVTIDVSKRTLANGQSTLVVSEVIIADAVGDLIIAEIPKDEKLRPKRVQVGARKKTGFGLLEIEW